MNGGGVFLVLLGIFLYFIPAIVGAGKKNAASIFLLNLFLGWTLIGWVVALVWASTKEDSLKMGSLKKCPKCAEEVKAEAVVCRFCNYEFPKTSSQKIQAQDSSILKELD